MKRILQSDTSDGPDTSPSPATGQQSGKTRFQRHFGSRRRVSQVFKLGLTQSELDFVDVDVFGDVRLFIDPRALRLLPTDWGNECVALIQSFFRTVLEFIMSGDNIRAERLLRAIREPNETHLGLSRNQSRGRALGMESAHDVWQSLRKSEAAKTGVLEHLEDTILMVEGIGADIVSDIATNIIRGPLIRYTQTACDALGIPCSNGVDSGPLWDPDSKSWHAQYVRLPIAMRRKLLLVPKVIVRQRMEFDCDEYFRDYILEHLRDFEMSANSELVQLLKSGNRRITQKSLIGKFGKGKHVIVRETLKEPKLLRNYRRAKDLKSQPPMRHCDLAEAAGTPLPDSDSLLNDVLSTPTGGDFATNYHKSIASLLAAIFYPALTSPQIEHQIHQGRKRIDIAFTNVAQSGFFNWLSLHYCSPHIFAECKNYGTEIGNPELDQLGGRFSKSRGQVGILLCRRFENRPLVVQRCRDTAMDSRGFILPLEDDDLRQLVTARRHADESIEFESLKRIFDSLIM